MARPRKDPAIKRLQGTLRKDREPAALPVPAGDPLAASMIAPIHLSELAQLQFARIAAMLEAEKRASPHYADVVALLAQRLEQVERFQAVLAIEGDTYTTSTASGSTMYRVRPEVALLSDAMRHAGALLAELMLSPTAALKVASGHKQEAGAFDDF